MEEYILLLLIIIIIIIIIINTITINIMIINHADYHDYWVAIILISSRQSAVRIAYRVSSAGSQSHRHVNYS
jgi:hypothetical protein